MHKSNRRKLWFFIDLKTQMQMRLVLLFRDSLSRAVYLISAIIFILILSSLNLHAEERSSIPVGIVDRDQSDYSIRLIQDLKEVSAIYLYEGELEELETLLLDGYISSIFVIKPGYEANIKKGETKELLELYSGKDDKTSVILSDIVAGRMMERISFHIGLNQYLSLSEDSAKNGARERSAENYTAYARKLRESGELDFAFRITYVDFEDENIPQEVLSNSIIYQQMIVGMLAMLLSFVTLFTFTSLQMEREQGLCIRRKLSCCTPFAEAAGNIVSILMLGGILCVIVSVSMGLVIKDKGVVNLVLPLFFLSLLYIFSISILYLLLSVITKTVFRYQAAGAAVTLLLGFLGFVSVFSEVLPINIDWIRFIPNGWYIKSFISILN